MHTEKISVVNYRLKKKVKKKQYFINNACSVGDDQYQSMYHNPYHWTKQYNFVKILVASEENRKCYSLILVKISNLLKNKKTNEKNDIQRKISIVMIVFSFLFCFC